MKTPLPQSLPSLLGNVIPAKHVRIAAPSASKVMSTCAVASVPGTGDRTPQVTLIREGDAVRAIRIVCSCGEVTQLDCNY